jgi:CheY-like chemotaxis protein/anti-sigma regulatory factor (Ser/Thr protein kinase)
MSERLELDRLKRQFLAALNHEVRTPLSGILGMTSLLEQSSLTGEQREYVQLTKACAEELYAVLSSTLEFTALAAGDSQLDESEFLLHEAIESLAAQWLVKARQKGIGFFLRIDDEVPEAAKGDELRFRKLLQHLLSNAVKFTERGQVDLVVSTETHASDASLFVLKVEVRDSGIGMTAEEVQKIFDSFEQIEGGLARRYSGLGLGLTLAQGLARVMGGDLQVESNPGSGSVFSFSIPLGHSTLETQFVKPAEKHVLVVDDNEAARKVAEAYLKRGGYKTTLASSGAEALKLAAEKRFDLVLMDLQMPQMDGIETTTHLRDVSGYERTPVLALTANVGDEYRLLCLSQGMQGYLPKPVDSELLLRTVRQLL